MSDVQNTANTQKSGSLYGGIVWIVSALALIAYGVAGLVHLSVPGVEELVVFLSTIEGTYLYGAAFLAILIEGLYVVGSFFPGSTLVVLLAVLSQVGGTTTFLLTILAIFVGWTLAGAINIIIARLYNSKFAKLANQGDYEVKDRALTTWFPAFRANYEVSQVAEGGDPFKVFLSSLRVKVWACLAAALYTLVLPFFIDIHQVSNEEGFVSLAVVAIISFTVGILKLRDYFSRD